MYENVRNTLAHIVSEIITSLVAYIILSPFDVIFSLVIRVREHQSSLEIDMYVYIVTTLRTIKNESS